MQLSLKKISCGYGSYCCSLDTYLALPRFLLTYPSFLSFRLVRNLSGDIFIQIPHSWISLPDKLYLALSVHIFYLLFPDYRTPAITAKLIINKLMQVIPGCKAMRTEIVLMLIDSSNEVIRHPYIQSRPRISHNINRKYILSHPAIISERFRTSRNDRVKSNLVKKRFCI